MKLLSFSIFLSALIVGGVIFATFWLDHKKADNENIFQITPSGNLVKYNKKTLTMTLCGLSGQKYRCLEFEKQP
ncbi:MAG: hypothetical protein ACRBBN_09385 [Methyloligellaceae bacterium]